MKTLLGKYGADGLQVIAVPCNQFGAQEPSPAAEIKEFARGQQGFRGVLTEKVNVNAPGEHALFTHLKAAHGGQAVEWNFEKWLLDGSGAVVQRYEGGTDVMELEAEIQALLGGGDDERRSGDDGEEL